MNRLKSGKLPPMMLYAMFILLAAVFLFPLVYMIANSLMSGEEILRYYSRVFRPESGSVFFHLIPDTLSVDGYFHVFLRQPEFLMKFWNSMLITGSIVLGQLAVSSLAGYAFAQFRFPFRNALFYLYIVFMMLPYLVTLLPNQIVARNLGLLDNIAALILPGIFSPFGVFLMRQSMIRVPKDVIEAAKIDGAGSFRVLTRVVLPQCKAGIASLVVLAFVDNWNMIEQPLILLEDTRKYPLSLFLSFVGEQKLDLLFACSLLAILPALLLFLYFEDEFISGVTYMGLQ
jgi:multiple sugar transport system permease protein